MEGLESLDGAARGTPTLSLPLSTRGGDKEGKVAALAVSSLQATILKMLQIWGRAQRRQWMVRDLEEFLAVHVGGWPRKTNRAGYEGKAAEANHAFASN